VASSCAGIESWRDEGTCFTGLFPKGKSSHGTVYLGAAFTIVKDRNKEIGSGLLQAMCKDLGIDPRKF
jgi:hypothetical protein